jgi:hypothetical protein
MSGIKTASSGLFQRVSNSVLGLVGSASMRRSSQVYTVVASPSSNVVTEEHLRRLSTLDDSNCRIELKHEAECKTDVGTVGPMGAELSPLVAALTLQNALTTTPSATTTTTSSSLPVAAPNERSTSLHVFRTLHDADAVEGSMSPVRSKSDPTQHSLTFVPDHNADDESKDDGDDDAMYGDGVFPTNKTVWQTADSAYGSSPLSQSLSNSSSLDDCRAAAASHDPAPVVVSQQAEPTFSPDVDADAQPIEGALALKAPPALTAADAEAAAEIVKILEAVSAAAAIARLSTPSPTDSNNSNTDVNAVAGVVESAQHEPEKQKRSSAGNKGPSSSSSSSSPAWRRAVEEDIRADKQRRDTHTKIRNEALKAKASSQAQTTTTTSTTSTAAAVAMPSSPQRPRGYSRKSVAI